MPSPLIIRLLRDAEGELARAADAVPGAERDAASHGLNAPGWILAHAAFFLDAWLSADAQGRGLDACDPWLAAWFRRQRAEGPAAITTPFAGARSALDRAVERTAPFLESLSELDLSHVPDRIVESGWSEGTTVGYLVARAVAHLFAHASELNVVATAAGARDIGLPGRLAHTSGRSPGG